MLKGRTRIELMRDGKIVKAYEHHNEFQAETVQKQLRTLGVFNNTYPFNSDNYEKTPWKELLGGIYLFDHEIPNGSEYAPPGIAMTANGAFNTPALGSEEMGAWEAANFVENKDSIQMSWTWTESQGNGNIRSVCLGNTTGALIGYGNSSGTYASSGTKEITANQTSYNRISINGYDHIIRNDYIYGIEPMKQDAETVKIYRKKISIENAALFANLNTTDADEVFEVPYKTAAGENTKLSSMNLPWNYYAAVDDKHWVGVYTGGRLCSPTENFICIIVDAEALTATVYSVKNNTSDTLGYSSTAGGDLTYGVAGITKDLLIAKSRNNLWIINIKTSEAQCLTEGMTVSTNTPTTTSLDFFYAKILPDFAMLNKSIVDGKSPYILDLQNLTIKPCNAYLSVSTLVYMEGHDVLKDDSSRTAFKNPFYLGTINNLPETITKDSTMTMRIIYTISREEDDD